MLRPNTRTFAFVLATALGTGAFAAGCGSDDNHTAATQADIHAAPTHLRWETYRGVPVPVADEGPTRITGPIATGYAPSPAGAALAAIESSVRVSVAGDADWPQVGQQLLAAGPGRDRWAIARAQVSITEPVAPGVAPRVLGYTITSYSTTRADIDVYTRQADNSVTRNSTTVIRRGDEWLLDLPTNQDKPVVAAVDAPPGDMVVLRPPATGAGR